ncbi:hypothetical protein BO71DRAFT_408505 [Aspergillus ellipticus CBS 707.79]|uniref:Uncharacterized protein n=1 Tax=Aspergillus ellipticus CBS 707.79 TaxID=1448320 RepID=A0A319DDJ0_9EURO|nr:hypothetical protein BO71DRAFT_408505 [Aspergillus ellipticus CBS 707.79]
MAQPNTTILSLTYYGPDETPQTLRAVLSNDVDVNILTRRGQQAVKGVFVTGLPTKIQSSDGRAYMAWESIRLCLFRPGMEKMAREFFHVPNNENLGLRVPGDVDAILGRGSFFHKPQDTDIFIAAHTLE